MTNICEAEKQFEEYRDNLRREVGLLADYVDLFRRLHQGRKKYSFEIDSAPAFFSLVTKSVFTAIILWANKLLDEKGQRGIFDFLKFIETNTHVFSIERLKLRRNFPDNYWVIEGRRKEGEITVGRVARDRKRLKNLGCLKSLKIRRNRYHAHFDKKYFFELKRLERDAPIISRDFQKVVKILWTIVNRYSVAYDSNYYESEAANVADLDCILRKLREHHKLQMKQYAN